MCNVINLRFRSPHGRRTCYSHSIHSSCGGKIIFRRHVRILLARFPDLNLGHVKFHPVFIPCIICIFIPMPISTRATPRIRDTSDRLMFSVISIEFPELATPNIGKGRDPSKDGILFVPLNSSLSNVFCLMVIRFPRQTVQETVIGQVGKQHKFILVIRIYTLQQCSIESPRTCR